MIVNHVDHHLHPAFVDLITEVPEISHRPVCRVDRPVVPVGVGAAEASLFPFDSDRVDGHEPDDVGAQGFDPVKVRNDGIKGPFRGVDPDIDGINDLILQTRIGVVCHGTASCYSLSKKQGTVLFAVWALITIPCSVYCTAIIIL